MHSQSKKHENARVVADDVVPNNNHANVYLLS
jgi:hypothetical protein